MISPGARDAVEVRLSRWAGSNCEPPVMDLVSLPLLSEAEGFLAEESMDQSIVYQENTAGSHAKWIGEEFKGT